MSVSTKDQWFASRRWRVVTEADGPVQLDGQVTVTFDHGRFRIETAGDGPQGAFRSPLSGNPGRRGVLLQEVDAERHDIPGSRYGFGDAAVEEARNDYNAIV